MDLSQLQNLIKRDPDGYKKEFTLQKHHFESELEIFKLRPTKECDRFTELVTFMSHVSSCYLEDSSELSVMLVNLFETNATVLHPDVRATLFQALILMRNKNIIDPLILIRLSFKLFSINDKLFRTSVSEYIFNDIKSLNIKKRNEKLNRSIQSILFNVVTEDSTITARKTIQILAELYRRRIWTDERTVNVIATGCLSKAIRVAICAINFFLGIESKMHDDDDVDVQQQDKQQAKEVNYHEHSKKTKKRQRSVQKQVERNSKIRKNKETKQSGITPLFPAIQLIYDPQSLAEKLFKRLRQTGERFEVKLLLMNFTSRLIGCHKLLLLSFYSFLQRYLTSHQKDVTHVLAFLIQACHDLVPPEELQSVIKCIAFNFINERCTNEVLTVGLNSLREIFVRVPTLLHEDGMADFIQDLVMYGKKTHKSVMIAAHGIVNLVR
jgi:protein SDA1